MDKKRARNFSKIYNHNIERIYRFVYIKVSSQQIAEDLTSEVFVRFWRTYQKHGQGRIKNPKAFLYKIARNSVIDYYRRKPVSETISTEEIGEIPDPGQQLEQKQIIASDRERTQRAIACLKGDYQDVILWHYLDGMPVRDIAEILDKSENAVRVMIHRAMKELRENLEKV